MRNIKEGNQLFANFVSKGEMKWHFLAILITENADKVRGIECKQYA